MHTVTQSEPVAFKAMSPQEKKIFRQKEKLGLETAPLPKKVKASKEVPVSTFVKAMPTKVKILAKVPKEAKRKSVSKDGYTELKKICAEFGIDTKLARRKLRAAKLSFHIPRERWVFSPEQVTEIESVLGE